MTTFTTYIAADLTQPIANSSDFDLAVPIHADPTSIVLQYPDALEVYYGSFGFDSFGEPTGTITGYRYLTPDGKGIYMEMSNFAITLDQFDAYIEANNSNGLKEYLFGGADVINGSQFGDVLLGFGGNDYINGGSGADILYGNMGFDNVNGGIGNDSMYSGREDDVAHGDDGDDLVTGDIGFDSVYGDAGNDRLYGGQMNDQLFGGIGNDLLSGDRGNDTLTGGAGADTFQFNPLGGTDVILDFAVGVDRILLSPLLAVNTGAALSAVSIMGMDSIINVGDVSITVVGVTNLAIDSFLIG